MKTKKTPFKWVPLFLGAVFLLAISCVEEFNGEIQIESFESVLVVDALITDETTTHEVLLTRVFQFEEDIPNPERNAMVQVVDDSGTEFPFLEMEPGVYHSQNEFSAVQGRTYTLNITTSDGRSYRSDATPMPNSTPIQELSAERVVNDLGEEGVSIKLDNTPGGAEPSYFRFEYEETYKIIAPRWDPFEMEVVHYIACDTIPYQVEIRPRQEEQRTCFASASSLNIIQASTDELTENRIVNKEVRYLSRDNYIISHRYSINVKQYSQTLDAFSYYERLQDFSSFDNLFSLVQPGLLEGNVFSETSSDEKVLGYFEVASVSTERMYFNYEDLFPDEPLPPYAVDCGFMGNPQLYTAGYHCDGFRSCDGACESPLIEGILAGLITFAQENEEDFNQPYFTWPSPCGDCTKIGSNVVPEFWIE